MENSLKTNKKANSIDVVASVKILEDCVSFEHIEDSAYIKKQLMLLNSSMKGLPEEIAAELKAFVNEEINPIISDLDYFDFLQDEQYGEYDEKGRFCIESEEAMEKMIAALYQHTLILNLKLFRKISKYI
ncbi:hypothetical protein [Coprococcus catus]|uniref:hypothetical protein n=1 Tax=Coprococcus catus TaxID=116085 RepID=UPI001C8BBAB1|nr:hypothetical protein [Coprococcus catus]MBX9230243.1 hypothetical protein [Coprococcus catus]MCT6798703.1 hypothetical protein [Coprococcus catus]